MNEKLFFTPIANEERQMHRFPSKKTRWTIGVFYCSERFLIGARGFTMRVSLIRIGETLERFLASAVSDFCRVSDIFYCRALSIKRANRAAQTCKCRKNGLRSQDCKIYTMRYHNYFLRSCFQQTRRRS